MNSITVVAAVIERAGSYLICRRPVHKRHGGLWEFPGGKLRAEESLEEAARRELEEELGMTLVRTGRRLFAKVDPGSRFKIEFLEVWADGDPTPFEHDELRWLLPSELDTVPLAPTDAAFADFLRNAGD